MAAKKVAYYINNVDLYRILVRKKLVLIIAVQSRIAAITRPVPLQAVQIFCGSYSAPIEGCQTSIFVNQFYLCNLGNFKIH